MSHTEPPIHYAIETSTIKLVFTVSYMHKTIDTPQCFEVHIGLPGSV